MLKMKRIRQERRKKHVRKLLSGTPERPRLTVHRTVKHIYAQIIDDTVGRTVAAISTVSSELKQDLQKTGNCAAAKVVGQKLAQLALSKGIKKICFDRGAFKYHGRVKALADGAREGGLEF